MEENASLLETPVTLGDIIDADSLQRVCMTFASLYQTGVAVLDSRGQVLVDIPAEHPFCRRIGADRHGASIACSFDAVVQDEDVAGDSTRARDCVCGLRYLMLGISHQGEALGRLVFGPYRPEGHDDLPPELVATLAGGEQRAAPEQLLAALGADLQRMPVRARASVEQAMSAMREVLSVIVQTGYARHLTSQIHIAAIQDAYNELTEKNRRLADSVEKLKEMDKLKSSFLATVSHELRTPLTSVIGYSEMLLEGLAGDLNNDQREYIQTIMEKGDHLLQIINEILDISKIESGTVQLTCEEFDVSNLLRQVSDALLPQARRKGVSLNYRAAAELPRIHADRAKTRQVLLNLVSNAVKFTPRGGRVFAQASPAQLELSSGEQVAAVEISVSDTGIGVPEAARNRIFEAFVQGDGSSTRMYGGTGLGLSIVKHFVVAHGGRVWVTDLPDADQGSVFVVQLPIVPPAGTAASRAPHPLESFG